MEVNANALKRMIFFKVNVDQIEWSFQWKLTMGYELQCLPDTLFALALNSKMRFHCQNA